MPTAETARLIASLELQDKNFTRGLSKVEKGVGRVDRKLGAFSGALNRNLGRAVDTVIARGVDALAGTIQDASDLNEEVSKSQAVFGKSSRAIIKWSDTTSSALGIAKADALAAAGNFGNMFKTVGLTDKVSADYSQTLVKLAADMASFNNEDPTEMLDKLRSGLSGEAEPLRRFGVLLSEAAVKEEAYASGIAKRGDKLTEAQKVQARYNLILKQTAVQQGDVEKTGGNLAGQQRKLNALLKDASATIGTSLLPVVTDLTSEFVKLLQDPGTQKGIKAFGEDLGKGAKALIGALKQVDWNSFKNALGSAAGFAKDLVTAFLGLPTWVQTAVITGWGLNKLTGGAVTSLFSGLASGLIKGVLGMNAGVVNINAGVVNGGGVPGVPTKGGPGLLGTAAKFLVPVTIAGITVAASKVLTDAIDPGFQRGLDEGRVPLANRDPRRFDKFGRVVEQWDNSIDRQETVVKEVHRGAPGAFRPDWRKLIGQIQTRAGRTTAAREGSTAAHVAAQDAAKKAQATTNAVKNAASIASRENSQQKAELGNIKNNLTNMDANQRAAAVAAAANATLQGALQAGRDALERTATRGAGNVAANASRGAGSTVAAAIHAEGAMTRATIRASRPIIQPTNVIEKYTTVVRGGATSDSRSGPLR